jgi:hypothetical protein
MLGPEAVELGGLDLPGLAQVGRAGAQERELPEFQPPGEARIVVNDWQLAP